MFENGNIKGSHGYTSISTGTTDDANYQYNNMVVGFVFLNFLIILIDLCI